MKSTEPRGTMPMFLRCPDCGHRYGAGGVFCPFDGQKLVLAGSAPPADPLLGTIVEGRYEVTGLLGEGGMGTVYEVRHTSLDRAFALKALRRDLAGESDLGERFLREARATAAVRHPNVVSISDFGHLADGRPYFVMEKLVGHTLASVLSAGGAMPAARAAMILSKVARALHAAHVAGIVHRDLKPENIFLLGRADAGPEQDVRVVDFGAAKIAGASRLTRAGVVFGTPYYMSPEQASGGETDPRSDVYALGIIMYELFTGKVPFEGDTYMGVLTQHLYATPKSPSAVLPRLAYELGALEGVTLKCLEKKPEKRFATMALVALAVESVVAFDEAGAAKVRQRAAEPGAQRELSLADALELPTANEMGRRAELAHLRAGRGATAVSARRLLLMLGALGLLAGAWVAWRAPRNPRPLAAAQQPALVVTAPVVARALEPAAPVPPSPSERRLVLAADVPAEIAMGGARLGQTPFSVTVAPGQAAAIYTLHAEGYVDQQVAIVFSSPERLYFKLRRAPAAIADASWRAPSSALPKAPSASSAPPEAPVAPASSRPSAALPNELNDPWK